MTFNVLQIDESLLKDHIYLSSSDECYYLGEYLPREGYTAGPVNDLISNLKKSVTRRGYPDYKWKNRAIAQAGELIRTLLSEEAHQSFTFVPVPPSKSRTDPLYDDRLFRILDSVNPKLDVREAVRTRHSARSHHEYTPGEKRPTPAELYANLVLDTAVLAALPLRANVFLFDDVLTNGTHFAACKRLLLEHRPELRVAGLFIGRTRRSTIDFF